MKALRYILAGGAALAALTVAAPASAQYYPGYGGGYGSPYGGGYGSPYGGGYGSPYGGGYGSPYGGGYGSPYGYGGGGGIIGQVIGSVIGGGTGYANNNASTNPYDRYGPQGRMMINQCMGAVQQRLTASYAANGYAQGGYQQQSGARVLGVSDVERRSNGGLSVRGVANSGRGTAYGYNGAYNGGGQVDLTFRCKTDASGYVVDIDIDQAVAVNGTTQAPAYTPYNQDYSQYGYRRY